MNNNKQTTQGNPIAPFSLDKMREAIEDLNYNKPVEPLKNVYVNEQGWQRLLTEVSGFTMSASMDKATYCGFLIISDQDVPHNQFIMCSAEDWGYYKQLCRHPWVSVSDMTDHQIDFAISLLKQGDKEPIGWVPLDTLSDLVYPYRASHARVEIDPFGFGKAIDSDTTT